MQVVYSGESVRIRPFENFAEINVVHTEDFEVPDPFRGPRWWPDKERELAFEQNGMLDHHEYSMSAVECLDTGELVGLVGNSPCRPGTLAMNIGTYILARFRHAGFAIEAKRLMLCRLFDQHAIQAVRASTMEHHARARAGLEACGMHYCGRLRSIEWAAERCYDEVQYVIFREEWEAMDYRHDVKRGM